MPTFRMNPNLELQEFTQPLLKKKKSSPSSVTSIITYNKDIHYVELSIFFLLLPFQLCLMLIFSTMSRNFFSMSPMRYCDVNIFAKADGLQNQAQPLEDFAKRLKPKEKNVVTMVGKTFDQLVSNYPDNVHLEVNDYLTTLLYKFGINEKQNNPFHRVSLA
ncbi:hypothetical protein HID58_015053 [Brassica napus]|uniref:Uncharacterized protein n=1 Tax=Brassica napus TaxID=3708 RepID=A0ABQ8DIW4_BRANA|nr:hypothetical protein HID58_015053 [Brassica napus]